MLQATDEYKRGQQALAQRLLEAIENLSEKEG